MAQSKKQSKADKKAAKRAELARQSAAVAAANWSDRPDSGKARPTPERRSKGNFVLRDTEDAGVTVAIDEAPTMLDDGALTRAKVGRFWVYEVAQ